MSEQVLVTGGAGFIGSHLVRALLAKGDRVRVLDNLSTGYRSNLAGLGDSVELVVGDIRDRETVQRAVAGVDRILHQAALVSMSLSVEDPLLCHAVNETGTLTLLAEARDAGVQKVVIASSAAVYGNDPAQPKSETMASAPASPYGWSKRTAELYAAVFSDLYGMSVSCLRYFNVFGPRQDPKSQYAAVIPIFARLMTDGRRPTIYGDGLQTRDFVFVEDVVQANLLALADQRGSVYNVATGQAQSLLDLVAELNRILGTALEPIFDQARAGDIRDSTATIAKITRELGYQPTVGFGDGLGRTVAWLRGGEETE